MRKTLLVIFLLVTASIAMSAVNAEPETEFVPNEFIVGCEAINSHILFEVENSGGIVLDQIPVIDTVLVYVPSEIENAFAAAMDSNPEVRYVERNGIYEAAYTPNDPYWNNLWGMRIIQADDAWDIHKGSTSVIVAIVDTGIDYTHNDLSAHYLALGYDWVNNDNDPMDDHWHGTHCAGTAAAIIDNGIGVAGVAQASLMAEKVLNAGGSGTWEGVAQGITHAADAGADVISMSLGGYGYSSVVDDACQYAWNKGCLIVAAAGNDNTNLPHYPSGYDTVIAVAATNRYDGKASYSNWGPTIEVAAPGGDGANYPDWIYSTYPGDSYAWAYGTSMATPHVSGLAALVWSYESSLTNQQLREHLWNTADDLGDLGWDQYFGYGRINAYRALNELGPPDYPPTCSIVDPVDGQTISGVYRVKVEATDDYEVSLVELAIDSGSWMDITGNFDGVYYFYDWDTTTVSDGLHTLDARATDNASQTTYADQITVTVDNVPGRQMHVGDIAMWYQKKGPWYWVYTTVPILDESGEPVPDATVYVDTTLPDGSVKSFDGTTVSDGTVTFKLKSKLTGTYTSTVTNVVKEGWTYDPASNIETSESLTVP